MIIVVNINFLFGENIHGEYNYLPGLFRSITRSNPQHEFVFIGEKSCLQQFVDEKNVMIKEVRPMYGYPLLWKWWYNVKVPAILKKYKAGLFVSFDGFCSLKTKIPQCMILDNLAFLHYPQGVKKYSLFFYKKRLPQFIRKTNCVITFSAFSKKEIAGYCKVSPEKIHVVYKGVKEIFHSIPGEEKAVIKNKYTKGKEYFVYAGLLHQRKNLVNLLKAFSIFKKRQQTGMKLVFAGKSAPGNESFLKSLASYKYRDDVVLTGSVQEDELVKIIASAYGFVCPSFYEDFGAGVAEAMKCDVPVIAANHSAAREVAGEAALYADVTDYHDLAEKMMLLYKNENLRKELIEKGRFITTSYKWDETADMLWKKIFEAVG